jgi:hypothetical protein
MNRDLRLGILAAFAAMLPGALLAALSVPPAVAVIVTIASGVAVVTALNRRRYRQAAVRTDAPLPQLQQLIAKAGVRRVLTRLPRSSFQNGWGGPGPFCRKLAEVRLGPPSRLTEGSVAS